MNCFLRDIVRAVKPVRATVTGEFAPRGGLGSRMTAGFGKRFDAKFGKKTRGR